MHNKFNLVFFIFFLSFISHADTDSDYESALQSFHKKKYNETIIHLKNALQENLQHIPSRLLLAETFIAQGNGELAETELYDLQASGVDFNQTITLLAQALILQNKYRKVLDIATPGYRGSDIESNILFSRGQAYLGLNQLKLAENSFLDALTLEPDFQLATLGLIQIAINHGQLDKATTLINKALISFEPIANTWIMNSVILQMKGQNKEALTSINRAIELSPEHLQARLNRATLLISQQSWEFAKEDLDYILNKIPAEPRAKYLRAIVSTQLGDKEETTKKINEVITTLNAIPSDVMANNPSYYFLAGLTNFNFGNLENARKYFQSYNDIKENDLSTMRFLAIIELRQNNPRNAKNILTKANLYFPDNPTILTLLGVSYMELTNAELAKNYFERVVLLVPNYSAALSNLAQSQIESGDYDSAINNLLSAEKTDIENVQLTLLLVESYLKSKQFKQAKKLTQKLIEIAPTNSHFQQQHGIALGFSGDIKGARLAFEKAITIDGSIDAYIHLARMDVIENKPQVAISMLQKALEKFPKNSFIIIELAKIHQKTGNTELALTNYLRAFSYDEQNSFALNSLVNYYSSQGELDKAKPLLLAYLQKHPKDTKFIIKLGQLYQKTNQPLKAIDAYKSAVLDAQDRTKVYMLLAKAQLNIDNRKAAIQSLNKAIAWDDKRIEPLIMLFPITLKQKDQARAEQIIFSMNQLLPSQDVSDIMTAELQTMLGQYHQAEINYNKALRKTKSQKTTLSLFQVLNQQKKYKTAQALIESWLIDHPKDIVAEIALAESYANQGKLEKTLKYYQTLLTKYNRMPILLNNSAVIANKLALNQVALNYAKEAYSKASNNVSIVDTYAWIQSQQGKRKEAIALFRQALVLDFNNAEIKYHLAVTLAQEDRLIEAKKLLKESVKSEQEFDEKDQAKQLLKLWKKG